MASALVLGFTLAPATAFASLTTNQGGTPTYDCPAGTTKEGNNCITPATSSTETIYSQPTVTTETKPIPAKGIYNCTYYIDGWTQNFYVIQQLGTDCAPGFHEWIGWAKNDSSNFETKDTYSCPNGYDLTPLNNCSKTITTPIPASTTPATVSGVSGGSLVASVTGFLSPVWIFIQEKLLPAIALLVILGISVRLSMKAVRKFSKVA